MRERNAMDPKRAVIVPWARILADVMTGSRLLCGALVIGISLHRKGSADPDTLALIVYWNMFGWTTDFFDGHLARYSGTPPSRIGRQDFLVDMMFTWATASSLAVAGYLRIGLLGVYFLIYLSVFALVPRKSTSMAFAAPIEALPLLAAFTHSMTLGLAYSLWLAISLAVFWKRFAQVVEEFVDELPPAARNWFRHLLAFEH
jgi:phosphatidylglycerophosphate synthase